MREDCSAELSAMRSAPEERRPSGEELRCKSRLDLNRSLYMSIDERRRAKFSRFLSSFVALHTPGALLVVLRRTAID